MKGIKERTIFPTSKSGRSEYVLVARKEEDKMKGKKESSKEESPIPMLILMTLILLGGILLAGFLLFSE
jgi:hypothetical protein